MTKEDRLEFCKICKNRKLDRNIGLICKLTNKAADFENMCIYFSEDVQEKDKLLLRDLKTAGEDEYQIGSNTKPSSNIWLGLLIAGLGSGGIYYIYYHTNISRFIVYMLLTSITLYGIGLIFKGLEQIATKYDYDEREKKIKRN